jgi:glucokinase
MMPAYALIGDIGGTNARLAVCNLETGKISNIQRFLTRDYLTFEEVITHFLNDSPVRLQ